MTPGVRGGGSRTKRVLVVAAGVVVVGAVGAAVLGWVSPDSGGKDPVATNLPGATDKVTRQTLVDRESEDGELGYGDSTSLTARLAGTVTGLPESGDVISRGQAVWRVDNTPVVLLYGNLPAYRTLSAGSEGADVNQLEKNLWALGYRGFTVDEDFTGNTKTAVKEWQEDLGISETGSVDPARVVVAAGAARVDSVSVGLGANLQPGTPVLTTTGTSRLVTVDLDVSDERLATKGAAVTTTLPDGRTAKGKIVDVTTVETPAEGQNPASTSIRVTVQVQGKNTLTDLDKATIDVGFTAGQAANVLTVPVTALLALSEGGYGVEVVDGTTSRTVAVETGLFADGRVEVSGAGIAEGTTIGVPA